MRLNPSRRFRPGTRPIRHPPLPSPVSTPVLFRLSWPPAGPRCLKLIPTPPPVCLVYRAKACKKLKSASGSFCLGCRLLVSPPPPRPRSFVPDALVEADAHHLRSRQSPVLLRRVSHLARSGCSREGALLTHAIRMLVIHFRVAPKSLTA